MRRYLCLLLAAFLLFPCAGCTTTPQGSSSGDIYTDLSPDNASFSLSTVESSSRKAVGSEKKKSSSARSTGKSSSTKLPKEKRVTFSATNAAYVETVGRVYQKGKSGLSLAWGGASICFDLICKGEIRLQFEIGGDEMAPLRAVFLCITVDGKALDGGRTKVDRNTDLSIAKNLSYGTHRIRIVRLTDGESAPLILTSATSFGELVKTKPPSRSLYIEAIGDASLIGGGVLLAGSTISKADGRSERYQDATKTYPYQAAVALQADCYVLARYGAGVSACFLTTLQTEQGITKTFCDPMGILSHIYAYQNLHSQSEYKATRAPDVIVLDAGAADAQPACLQMVAPNGISSAEAVNRAAAFLNEKKARYPNVKILWCYGFTTTSERLNRFVKTSVLRAGGEENGIYTLALPTATRPDYPTETDHKNAAVSLQKKIKSILQHEK